MDMPISSVQDALQKSKQYKIEEAERKRQQQQEQDEKEAERKREYEERLQKSYDEQRVRREAHEKHILETDPVGTLFAEMKNKIEHDENTQQLLLESVRKTGSANIQIGYEHIMAGLFMSFGFKCPAGFTLNDLKWQFKQDPSKYDIEITEGPFADYSLKFEINSVLLFIPTARIMLYAPRTNSGCVIF